jgi:ABC-type bacteriocin/lantibiotic exporter with double-glycine peptidase domain
VRRSERIKGTLLFAPEVVQTSVMDCGPAALACLLKGFGIRASYPRLQEACSTDVDGTSINTLEQIAGTLGLEVEQIMLPIDHLLLPSAGILPALVVVRRDNLPHFLVVWRRHGPLVQIMDPAKGRRWLSPAALHDELYVHHQRVPAGAWREWAGSPDFLNAVRQRMRAIDVKSETIERLVGAALDDDGWRSLAVLDASVRMVSELVRTESLRRGRDAAHVLTTIARRTAEGANPGALVPTTYWSVLPDDAAGGTLVLRGAVLLAARGRRMPTVAESDHAAAMHTTRPSDVQRVVAETSDGPIAEAWRLLRADGRTAPIVLTSAIVIAAVGGLVEVMLLRGALELGNMLALREQRLMAVGLVLAVIGALLVLDLATTSGVLRLGRRLETRLRAALLAKLPTLGDRYFRSRPVADLAHRAHTLDALRQLPELGARFLRTSLQLLCTALAIVWLDPNSGWLAVLSAACALAIPLGAQRLMAERELRQRSHSSALSRHYLDSLLGLTAARTHAAERPLRQRHESLLVDWGRSSVQLLRGGAVIEGAQLLVGSLLAVWLVLMFVGGGNRPGSTLLFVYWALSLPMLGRDLAGIIRQFPAYRNILMRVLEPLAAPAETPAVAEALPDRVDRERGPVEIRFDNVDIRAGGYQILSEIQLTIAAGEHVAIVGRSGAGKSTLMGALLGWHAPTAGTIRVDGEPLTGEPLVDLRRHTAWVDPSVHLWNRSLFDNLRYGDSSRMITSIGPMIETAQLTEVLEKLPFGLQSPLGEAGALTSGGEGQRVRFGRALLRDPVRLAILDEPFRGLDRDSRHRLLARAREVWRDVTLICVTHDIEDTLAFERVVVVDAGRIVEDGTPSILSTRPDSPYAALLAAERAVRADLWNATDWRRWRMHDGSITEDDIAEVNTEWTLHQHRRGH